MKRLKDTLDGLILLAFWAVLLLWSVIVDALNQGVPG